MGEGPPWAVAPPTHLPQERGGSIIIYGVCVSGGDEVRTFGAWCLLEMFRILSQIAYQHFGTKPHDLGELVVVTIPYQYNSHANSMRTSSKTIDKSTVKLPSRSDGCRSLCTRWFFIISLIHIL